MCTSINGPIVITVHALNMLSGERSIEQLQLERPHQKQRKMYLGAL